MKKCYPNYYDAADNPFLYFRAWNHNPSTTFDSNDFFTAIDNLKLPSVSFVKPLGIHSERPVASDLTDGQAFVNSVVQAISTSDHYYLKTLILIAHDDSGGYICRIV